MSNPPAWARPRARSASGCSYTAELRTPMSRSLASACVSPGFTAAGLVVPPRHAVGMEDPTSPPATASTSSRRASGPKRGLDRPTGQPPVPMVRERTPSEKCRGLRCRGCQRKRHRRVAPGRRSRRWAAHRPRRGSDTAEDDPGAVERKAVSSVCGPPERRSDRRAR
jgi:hypothetical protein